MTFREYEIISSRVSLASVPSGPAFWFEENPTAKRGFFTTKSSTEDARSAEKVLYSSSGTGVEERMGRRKGTIRLLKSVRGSNVSHNVDALAMWWHSYNNEKVLYYGIVRRGQLQDSKSPGPDYCTTSSDLRFLPLHTTTTHFFTTIS